MKTISAKEFNKVFQEQSENTLLLDVRTREEHLQCRIPGAKLIPLSGLPQQSSDIPKNKLVYLYCRTGNRSRIAIDQLESLGFNNLVNIDGGIQAFKKCGGKIIQGQKTIPVNQQVHIVAGSLVLLGTILAVWANPWFFILPGLVGAGLAMAGITGFCGMEKLLNRMPWNRQRINP